MYELQDVSRDLKRLPATNVIVLLSGAFDILHKGHVIFLNKSKKLGDVLVVGVQSDERVSKKKGHLRPIVSEQDRAHVVSNIKSVDYTFILRESLLDGDIEKINPQKIIFCKEVDQDFLQYEEVIKKYNQKYPDIECIILNRESAGKNFGNSTSKTIKKILDRYAPK